VVGTIAVGGLAFVENVKSELGSKAMHRENEHSAANSNVDKTRLANGYWILDKSNENYCNPSPTKRGI
jgi:hypothetical protein